MSIEFVVLGEPASKANSRKLVRFGNRPAINKVQKARDYVNSFKLQCPKLKHSSAILATPLVSSLPAVVS